MKRAKLKVGEWVEVRSKDEILKTLDSQGQLDGMPFMPEMFAFCGQSFQVYKRAHKTCDTVFPIRGRRVHNAVHLQTRCDGQAHDGCEAECLLFWKEAWLKPLNADTPAQDQHSLTTITGATEAIVYAHTKSVDNTGVPRYSCQATRLPEATTHLDWWDLRQYLEDYQSGNVGLWRIICGCIYSLYYNLSQAGIGVGPAFRWFYNTFHWCWRGTCFPRATGTIPEGQPTPTAALNLQPGELVRIKSHEEILKTLNTSGKNRGMGWDAEMVPYCGNTYRVLRRVTKIVNERTGEMAQMKTPAIILNSVVCQSRYSHCRMFCPRSIYSYWREIWLERLEPARLIPEAHDREPAPLVPLISDPNTTDGGAGENEETVAPAHPLRGAGGNTRSHTTHG